jgi:hypothetical protein
MLLLYVFIIELLEVLSYTQCRQFTAFVQPAGIYLFFTFCIKQAVAILIYLILNTT